MNANSNRRAGRVFPLNRETRAYLEAAIPKPEPLKAGEVFRDIDGRFHFVQYVNTSGAYAVPLTGVTREIGERTIHFVTGGKTISVNSMVHKVDPLSMGGNSQEYRRYVKMVSALKEGGMAKRKVDTGPGARGVTFNDFDDSEFIELESTAAEGQTAAATTETPNTTEADMAKKAKKAAKKDKPTKTVRRCACGCDGETTGHFVPGHDARMHGWIKKLGDGRIDVNGKDAKSGELVISKRIINALGVTATKNGAKIANPHFWQDAE